MTDTTELNAETARESIQIAKLISMNKRDGKQLREDRNTWWYVCVLIDMIGRQQQIIDYALARIEALEAANSAREGDGK